MLCLYVMISQRVANIMIFGISVILTLLAIVVFIFTMVALDIENRGDILIGTGVGSISGLSLSIYIWCNRNNLHH